MQQRSPGRLRRQLYDSARRELRRRRLDRAAFRRRTRQRQAPAPRRSPRRASAPGIADFAPDAGSTINTSRPAVYASFAADAVPVNPSSALLWIDGRDVTSECVRTAQFIQYLPSYSYPDGRDSASRCASPTRRETRPRSRGSSRFERIDERLHFLQDRVGRDPGEGSLSRRRGRRDRRPQSAGADASSRDAGRSITRRSPKRRQDDRAARRPGSASRRGSDANAAATRDSGWSSIPDPTAVKPSDHVHVHVLAGPPHDVAPGIAPLS